MSGGFEKQFSFSNMLKCGASLAVLGAFSAISLPATAYAQDADEVADEETEAEDRVVVTGVRESLKNAQDIKRDASTIVDSITEADIGAFPDKSVAEALQRVAGITVNRFAASSDTAHFSAEPSGVIVRGLQQVRSEFNGRDTFSANSSRGLSWGDVSPELMSGVDTYKNSMASLIEGGIAGTVNLRTRVPFDQKGELIAVSGSLNYGDLSRSITPEVSGIYSNRWETDLGEFGLLGNFAYSDVQTASQGIQLYRMNRFDGVYGDGIQYMPASITYRDNIYDRTRTGLAFAGQWRDTEDKWLATLQFNRSKYENAWEEYLVSATIADLSYGQSVNYAVEPGNVGAPQPAPGTDFAFGNNGLFESGFLTQDIGWWGADAANSAQFAANENGQPMVTPCYGWNGCEPTRRHGNFGTTTRSNNNENITQDLGFNLKYTPNDDWRFNIDVQRITSTVKNYDIEVGMDSFAAAFVDLTGEYPTLELTEPSLNINPSAGFTTNPNNYSYRNIMDHVEDSEGEELAIRGDVEYVFNESGWLDSLQVGARYADRDQTVRWSTYNWQNVANSWTQNADYWNIDQHAPCDPSSPACNGQNFQGYPTGSYETRFFSSPFDSGYLQGPSQFVFFNMGLLQDQQRMAEAFGASSLGFVNGVGWDPICSNTGDRAQEIPGTCYTPSEIIDISEETLAFYGQLNFGGDDAELFGFPVSGNVGLRYVETTNSSTGGASFPQFSAEQLVCEDNLPTEPGQPLPPVPRTLGCYISAEDIAFAAGGSALSTAEKTHEHWLPSLNIKVDLNDEWVLRFAGSRAISRPDIGNMRNFVNISAPELPDTDNADDPLWVKDASGEIVGATAYYSASAQNPFLSPVQATQFDLSLEYYFADVGSLTFAAFHKSFEDYIQFGKFFREFENNGVTRTVEVFGPLNGEGASIQGFEVSYQQFYDFLPEPLNGLGVQANYTFINNDGVSNSDVTNTGPNGSTLGDGAAVPDRVEVNRLEGLSDHAFNLIGMYEKGGFAARLAYNWRSEFLVTAIDCCVSLPIWNKAQGFLDGSVRVSLNDNMEISMQGSNLLNTKTVLEQQVVDGVRLPNAWFQNDRRFTVGVRLKYN